MKKILLIISVSIISILSLIGFGVALAQSPDTVELAAKLEVRQKEGVTTAILSWNAVPEAALYCVNRNDRPGHRICFDASEGTRLDVTNHPTFPDTKATDKFTVIAAKRNDAGQIDTIASDNAIDSEVVRAPTEFGNVANLGEYAGRIMKYALPLGIALAVLMTIYAGIMFMLSQGSPDKVKEAQEIIQGAIVGLVLLIMIRLLIDFFFIDTNLINSPNALSQGSIRQNTRGSTLVDSNIQNAANNATSAGSETGSGANTSSNSASTTTGTTSTANDSKTVGTLIFGKAPSPVALGQYNTVRDYGRRCHRGIDFGGRTTITIPFEATVIEAGPETEIEKRQNFKAPPPPFANAGRNKAAPAEGYVTPTLLSPGGGVVRIYVPEIDMTLIFRHLDTKTIQKKTYAAGTLKLTPAPFVPVNKIKGKNIYTGYSTDGPHHHIEVIPGNPSQNASLVKGLNNLNFPIIGTVSYYVPTTIWQQALYEYESKRIAHINPMILFDKTLGQAKAEKGKRDAMTVPAKGKQYNSTACTPSGQFQTRGPI